MSVSTDRNAAVRRRGRNGIGNDGDVQTHKRTRIRKGELSLNDYYTPEDALSFAFYRVPKALITDPCYHAVSTDAKLLYGLLLDRMELSLKNGWQDERERVFLYFTVAAIQKALCCCKEKACKLLRELEDADLIERKRQGQGFPARIYVKRFQRSEIPTSRGLEIRP